MINLSNTTPKSVVNDVVNKTSSIQSELLMTIQTVSSKTFPDPVNEGFSKVLSDLNGVKQSLVGVVHSIPDPVADVKGEIQKKL